MYSIEQTSFDTITITPHGDAKETFLIKKETNKWCVYRQIGDEKPQPFPRRAVVYYDGCPPDKCDHPNAEQAVNWVKSYITDTHNEITAIVDRHQQ